MFRRDVCAAGSFGLAMFYRGRADDCFVPLCPLTVRPKHWVIEVGDDGARSQDEGWNPTRQPNANVLNESQLDRLAFAPGVQLPPPYGPRSHFPMAAREFSSRLASRIWRKCSHLGGHLQATGLRLERTNGPLDRETTRSVLLSTR